MSGFLLDTNSISELVRPQPDGAVLQWFKAADESLLYMSVLTLGEIRRGLATLPQGYRRTRLESWLDIDLRIRFEDRILPVDADIADRWGVISAQARSRGKALPVIDGLLAATALRFGLTVVTRNVADFERANVPVLNPWLSVN